MNRNMLEGLERRIDKDNFCPEVLIEDTWVKIEPIMDCRLIFTRETVMLMFREKYGNNVADWLIENMPNDGFGNRT